MKTAMLSLAQIRRWQRPENWMVNGYSQTQDIFHVPDTQHTLDLPAGGWSLSAADLVRLIWDNPVHEEGMFTLIFNMNRIYKGLWLPRLREPVTESFFWNGDLLVMNYRLLSVRDAVAG